jgi:hypothetical protein
VDVCGYDPEVLALLDDSIQLFAVANAVRVLVVQVYCRPVVGTDLMEGVPSETITMHDLLVREFVECLSYSVGIPLELALSRVSSVLYWFGLPVNSVKEFQVTSLCLNNMLFENLLSEK